MNKYRNRRIRYVFSQNDINTILKLAEANTNLVYGTDLETSKKVVRSITLRNFSFIEDTKRYISVTTRYAKEIENKDGSFDYVFDENYACTWKFDKTGEFKHTVSPGKIAMASSKIYKPFDIIKEIPELFDFTKDNKCQQSAKSIIGFNPKYDRTENYIYEYDLNSAFALPLLDKIPDTYHFRMNDIVGENEIGFLFDDDLTMINEGKYADYIFPLIDSPYKDYVKKWYDQKKNSPKGSKEKNEAKQYLVITVGLWQNHNPFLRAYVVGKCNEKIQKIIDENKDYITLWNTDAVYSTKPLDLDIGDNIGQFKLEYEGLFRQVGNNYQIVDTNDVSYRGVCKILFKNKLNYNILVDGIPEGKLPFCFNKDNWRIDIQGDYENG